MASTTEYSRINAYNDEHAGKESSWPDINLQSDAAPCHQSNKRHLSTMETRDEHLLDEPLLLNNTKNTIPPEETEVLDERGTAKQIGNFDIERDTVSSISGHELLDRVSESPLIRRKPVIPVNSTHSSPQSAPPETARSHVSQNAVSVVYPVHAQNCSMAFSSDKMAGSCSCGIKEPEAIVQEVSNESPGTSIRSDQSKQTLTGSWRMEVLSFILGLFSLAAVVGVLAHFDGKKMPQWPT